MEIFPKLGISGRQTPYKNHHQKNFTQALRAELAHMRLAEDYRKTLKLRSLQLNLKRE